MAACSTAVTWVGQTFVPGVSGALSRLEVSLFCFLCRHQPRHHRRGEDDERRRADLDRVGHDDVAGFSSGSSTFYSAVFTSPAMLTAGTTCLHHP